MPDQDLSGPNDAEVVTAARGLREANSLLQQGWRIITVSVHPEQLPTGGRRRVTIWMPIFIMGRRFAEGETPEAVDLARERASDAGDDVLRDGEPVVERATADDEEEGAEPIPESVTPPARAARSRTAHRGQGAFAVTGIPGD